MTRNEQCCDQAHSTARPVAGKNRARQEVLPISVAYTKSCLRCPIDVLPATFWVGRFRDESDSALLENSRTGVEAAICILLYDAECQMRYARGLNHLGSFQLDLLAAEMLEQSDTFTEEYGHELDLYFVKKTRF